jgi:hypothetical protein
MLKQIENYIIKENVYSGLENVTENGEVCYDYYKSDFVIFDETYAYEVGRTKYAMCAYAMLVSYTENYI